MSLSEEGKARLMVVAIVAMLAVTITLLQKSPKDL